MTLLLIAVITLFSLAAFRYKKLLFLFDLSPSRLIHEKEYYRVLTHAFLHADYVHLIVNMIVFFSFGTSVERIFKELQANDMIGSATVHYFILFLLGIVLSALSTIVRYRNNPGYSSVGASGMVSAMVFAHIFFQPMQKIYFYFAIPIPGIVFGILYLIYSSYMGRKNRDNINHEAHLWGAVFGFFYPVLMNPSLARLFIDNLSP
jgi:membrane associated rhomboid family serine protease